MKGFRAPTFECAVLQSLAVAGWAILWAVHGGEEGAVGSILASGEMLGELWWDEVVGMVVVAWVEVRLEGIDFSVGWKTEPEQKCRDGK